MGRPATYERTLHGEVDAPRTTGEDARNIPFGLFELDAQGTVVRYSPASEAPPAVAAAADIRGRSFFTEIAPVEQVAAFRLRFHAFMSNGQAVERFTATFAHGERNVKVQIMLAHITEKSEEGSKRLALVRIMPE